MGKTTLYTRLGGYDAIAAVTSELLTRLRADAQVGRFWQHRGEDGLKRQNQLLTNFLCSCAGGPIYYTGRDLMSTHRGMNISETDWAIFIDHLNGTLEDFKVPETERQEILKFFQSTKPEIVES